MRGELPNSTFQELGLDPKMDRALRPLLVKTFLRLFDDVELDMVRCWRDFYKELSRPGVSLLRQRVEAVGKRHDHPRRTSAYYRQVNGVRLPPMVRDDSINVKFHVDVFSQLAVLVQKATAEALLRQQLVAVLEARLKTGVFALKLAPPLDPFSGKPLLYRMGAEGFVLYSVGENGKDDGGSDDEETITKGLSKTTRTKDILVRYGKP